MERRLSTAEWLAQQYVPDFVPRSAPAIRLPEFRPFGYDAARKLSGKFVEDLRPGICKNHDIALLVFPKRTIRILLHHDVRLLAFARYHEAEEGYGGYDFTDAPDIQAALGETFAVASKSVLEKQFDFRALQKAVGRDKDIDYWNPKRIGDVLFNFWD